ncbi:Zinc finger protein-like 1, partial [Caligus rogercresseyi]
CISLGLFGQVLPFLALRHGPGGYSCITCGDCIFPPDNLVSPVADELRRTLSDVNWARAGLGMKLLENDSEIRPQIGPRPTPEGECLQ